VVSAVASCQLCGSPVAVDGDVAKCLGCGAEYDVVRHGRRGDFSKSAEVSVNAQKKATEMRIYLFNPAETERLEGKTVTVGTVVRVISSLWREPWYTTLYAKRHIIYHRLNTGTWERIIDATSQPGFNEIGVDYTIRQAGKHTFYAEFPGDDEYLGCPSEVHGMRVQAQDHGVSPEVSVEALQALTVLVKDMVFKKPIEGAKVSVNTTVALTDASGIAVFDALAPGSYTLSVSASDYKSETRSIDLTEAGKVEEVHLLPLWAIAAGVVGVGAVGIVVAHKALKR